MPAEPFLLAVGIGLCVIASAALERRTQLPIPVFLVPAGVALAYAPGVPDAILRPDVVFYVFLPPLVYASAFFTTPRQWRANWRPIALLAVGLVVATVFVTAAVAVVAVVGLGWAAAFVLGAVVSPTDPVAATGVIGRLGAPARLRTVLEGESLVNDGVALVIFSVAVSAARSGSFSLLHGLLEFVEAFAGGVAIGVVVGWTVTQIRRRVHDTMIEITISLLTPYVAYVPAQQAHVSGVLATVTAGAFLGWNSEGIFRPHVRVQSYAFWQVLTFLLESTLFVLLGLQFPVVVGGLSHAGTTLAWWGLVVFATVVGVRLLWQFTVPPLLGILDRRLRGAETTAPWRERLVVGWAGIRGALTLAAALSIPADVPGRRLVLYLAFAVVLASILVEGLSLPWLVSSLGLAAGDATRRREDEARVCLAEAALRRLDELADDGVEEERIEPFRLLFEERRSQATSRLADEDDDGNDGVEPARVEAEVVSAQREVLHRLVDQRKLDPESARALQRELDMAEVRLPHGRP